MYISDIAFAIDASFLVIAPQIRDVNNNGARVFKAIEIVNARKDPGTAKPGTTGQRPAGERKEKEDEDWTAWKDPNAKDSSSVRPKRVLTAEDSLLMQRRKLHQDSIRAGLIR